MSSGSTITSTTNEEFVLGRKLLVHVAENGHSLEFECDGATLVEAIQRSIEALCGVALVDQLLLCRNTSLDSQQPLSYYKLPQDDREVFLYNKTRLHADSPRPPPEAIELPKPAVPPPSSPNKDSHPLDNAPDPALKALISYERQFLQHFQSANAMYGCAHAKLEVCRRLLREQQVQGRALETARGNLEHTFRKLNQRYTDFTRCFAQQHRSHSDLLANFERDVQRLGSLRLHPRLQTGSRKCLFDLVKEDDLRKWVTICFNSHRQFETKVTQLKTNFAELKRRLESLVSTMSSASWGELDYAIKNHHKILNDQKSVMQSLSKDVDTAKKLVDDSDLPLSPTLRPHDAVSALGRIYDVHEKSHIPNMQNCDHAMSKFLDKCLVKKNDMNLLVHLSMQKVKSVQFGIRDMMNELHAFQEVMGHQDKEFENLKFVNGIGQAYRACLAEIVRRKSSLKLYMGLAGQLAERLATEREAEIRRREVFFKTWSKYIPNDILSAMGLFDSPSQCDVHIAPYDTNLLEIDVIDVDRLAPQSLVGLNTKFDKNASQRGYLASCSTSNISKSEESSLQSGEKMEFLEGCESVDIAGTSKLEVENALLKADLASAIAMICAFNAEIGYDSLDEDTEEGLLKNVKEKTAEALHLKDEFTNHLQSMLNMKQEQCLSYEKRIKELEQRLSDQYLQGQKLAGKDILDSDMSATKNDDYKLDIFGDGDTQMPYTSIMPMDEASSTSGLVDPKINGQASKPGEGGDENMSDLSGTLNINSVDSTHNPMDASMLEQPRDESQVCPAVDAVKMMTPELTIAKDPSGGNTGIPVNMLPCDTSDEPVLESKDRDDLMLDLQKALTEKSNQCNEMESKLKATAEEVDSLKKDLEKSRNLLDESQMNCVHLENCLHEAREDARTNLCAAERRASEYNALRSKAVKMRSLFERFRACVTSPGAVASFADSLRSLAVSLASSLSEDEDDFTREFQACIKVFADKVTFLSRHRADLSDRCSRVETAHGTLLRELEEKNELLKSLYNKHQLEKQANKEKITFGRFEVHELAAFILNSAGHYEAINRNCPNYYLSEESVALFKEQHSSRPAYIIGQIVHIERLIVRSPISTRTHQGDQLEASNSETSNRRSIGPGAALNTYNLPIGCEYFIVTVAMLPDTIHSTS
ncbi:autophagy-related protein [Canna indica]|uniref:Autophagy-related protein n=1 Tax=Canna indica TaxID=4628 RepID=A0AAQ3JRT1_9LILI|nr:autophagy-related protein [Canna indica]